MVSTHCHFLQKAAWGRARASSYCTYSFFNVARYAIPVARGAISVSREGGNLLLSGTVLPHAWISMCFELEHLFISVAGSRSIMCGALGGFCSLPSLCFPLHISVTGACLLVGVGAHGWVVRFCQPSAQSPSWRWLPIVEAPGCLRHPTSTERRSCLHLFLVLNCPGENLCRIFEDL